MPNAKRLASVVALLGMLLGHAAPVLAIPAEYQLCKLNANCTIGEYFFDDNSLPITTGATCELLSYNPAGSIHFNNVSLTPTSDGWYAHTFSTSGYTQGIYRSNLCCTYSGDRLCIDKTFQVGEGNLTSTDIENAVLDADLSAHNAAGSVGEQLGLTSTLDSTDVENALLEADLSSHTTSGTVGERLNDPELTASGVWGYSFRTLSSFGTLITDISTALQGSFDNLATLIGDNSDTEASLAEINSNISNLQSSVDSIDANVNNINGDVSYVRTTVNTINTNTSNSQALANLTNLVTNLSSLNAKELSQISAAIADNRTYLETLINSPVITSGTGDSFNPDSLNTQLTQAQDYLNQIYANTQSLVSRLGLLLLNWDTLTQTELTQEVEDLLELLGNDPNASNYDSSVIYQLNWFTSNWSNPTTNNTYADTFNSLTNLSEALNQLKVTGKSNESNTLLSTALSYLENTEARLGNLSSAPGTSTLYGFIKLLNQYIETLSQADQDLANLIANWSTYNTDELDSQLDRLQSTVVTANQIPDYADILESRGTSSSEQLQNRALALRALIALNQRLIGNGGNNPIQIVWIESDGEHIVFQVAAYNPSSESQPFDLRFTLPKELVQDDILEQVGSISVAYNPEVELFEATGSLTLKGKELSLHAIKTNDFFTLPGEVLDTLRTQAADLLDSLDGTAFYTQGAALKSDIDASLTKIAENQSGLVSPLDRIATYRANLLELETVKEKLAGLVDLVNQATATNSIFGFVGGIQAVSVWGIILIVIAGFVFLTIYMKKLNAGLPAPSGNVGSDMAHRHQPVKSGLSTGFALPWLKDSRPDQPQLRTRSKRRRLDRDSRLFHVLFIALTTTALSSMIAGSVTARNQTPNDDSGSGATAHFGETKSLEYQVAVTTNPDDSLTLGVNSGETSPTPEEEVTKAPPGSAQPLDDTTPPRLTQSSSDGDINTTQTSISPPLGSAVNIRSGANLTADVITKIIRVTPVTVIDTDGDWSHVSFTLEDSKIDGFVHADFLTTNRNSAE
jgi:hypothetical protein